MTTAQLMKDMVLQLEVSLFCHSATSFVDHFGEVFHRYGKESVFAQLRMYRA